MGRRNKRGGSKRSPASRFDERRAPGMIERVLFVRLDPVLAWIPLLGPLLLWMERNDLETQRRRASARQRDEVFLDKGQDVGSDEPVIGRKFLRGYHGSEAEFLLIPAGLLVALFLAWMGWAPRWLLDLY